MCVDLTTNWTPEDRAIASRVGLTNMTISSDMLEGIDTVLSEGGDWRTEVYWQVMGRNVWAGDFWDTPRTWALSGDSPAFPCEAGPTTRGLIRARQLRMIPTRIRIANASDNHSQVPSARRTAGGLAGNR